jgi:colanic acid biosynthesis glycosyl transferase WcaI
VSSRIVILTQVYVPDPASVGQHMHDFAAALAARGHEVIVYCSSRGYDDASHRYVRSEIRDGVRIHRYSLPIFSKRNMLLRVFGSAWAQLALFFNALTTLHTDVIFFSTSPPLIGVTATIVAKLKAMFGRHVPRVYWAMDLNPDQLVAMGKVQERSFTHRILEAANRFIIRNADLTVPLDRFMDARLRLDGRRPQKVAILPPWPHEKAETPLPHADNWFRDRHGLQGKFVVMYSGNHSPANPLDTLLAATLSFKNDDSIRFAFIGGGAGKKQVTAHIARHGLTNCLDLPYQPLADLRYSLSAADAHVVSLGADMVGIIHPCKVYGSMAVGRPILFLGPKPSHVSDLLEDHQIGWHVEHNDVDGCVRTIREMKAADKLRLAQMGDRAQVALRSSLSQEILAAKLCDEVEALLQPAALRSPATQRV